MRQAVWSSIVLATILSTVEAMITPGPEGEEDYSGTLQREGPECELPMDPGNYNQPQIRYYYNKLNGQCTIFTYSGRGGNLNNFLSMSACNQRCVCSRKVSVGMCGSKMPRYFYNQGTGLCQLFSYSGCGGNANNFATEAECNFVCTSDMKPRCFRRPEFGSCSNYTLKYYYDAQCGCCRQFTYSGCEGNLNNFETEQICLNRCGNENLKPAGGDSVTGSTSSAAPLTRSSSSMMTSTSTASPTAATTSSATTPAPAPEQPNTILQIVTNTGPAPGSNLSNMFQQLLTMLGG